MNARTFELTFTSNTEVDDALIEAAVAPPRSLTDQPPSERVLALLERMAEVARPGEESGRMLDVLAHVARSTFVEGLLDVLLQADPEGTVMDVLVYDGLNFQRAFPTWLVPVPLHEFLEWIARRGSELSPLELIKDIPGTEVHLQATREAPKSMRPTVPPEPAHQSPTLRIAKLRMPHEALASAPASAEEPPPATRRAPAQGDPHSAPTVEIAAVKPPAPPPGNDEVDGEWE